MDGEIDQSISLIGLQSETKEIKNSNEYRQQKVSFLPCHQDLPTCESWLLGENFRRKRL